MPPPSGPTGALTAVAPPLTTASTAGPIRPGAPVRRGATPAPGRRRGTARRFPYPVWLFGYGVGIGMGTIWGLGLAMYIH
jgi:hypothetical protein